MSADDKDREESSDVASDPSSEAEATASESVAEPSAPEEPSVEAAPAAEAEPKPAKPKRTRAPKPKPKAEEPKADEPVAEESAAEEPAAEEPPAEELAPEAPAKVERPARRREPVELPVVRAQAKYVKSSARKARLVCDNIRGKSVIEARAILAHTPRAVARDWSKLLESAIANAEHNHELVGEDLYVKAVRADEGPTAKRFRPRAMGRATRIRKRTAHLTILLTPKD